MSSILTNASAMTALQTLAATNKNLATTQIRISTGLRVSEAADNAAYWSIATTMRSDNNALSAVKDALGLGASKIDTAYTGLNVAQIVVDKIKKLLVSAREPGVDRAKVQEEITTLQAQLKNTANSASTTGQNWLSVKSDEAGYNAVKQIVGSFSRDAAGSVSVGTVSVDTAKFKLFDASIGTDIASKGILDGARNAAGAKDAAGTFAVATLDISNLSNSDADLAILDSYIKGVDAAVQEMISGQANLGASKSRVDLQKDFVSKLMDAIDRGIGTLVDADMNAESARLSALQVQQQLGVQSLSIANASAQSILTLFRI